MESDFTQTIHFMSEIVRNSVFENKRILHGTLFKTCCFVSRDVFIRKANRTHYSNTMNQTVLAEEKLSQLYSLPNNHGRLSWKNKSLFCPLSTVFKRLHA